jgi:vacuolar-type H+-ATPase subunit E/Vma4
MSLQDLIQQIEKEADAQIAALNDERDKAIYEIQKEYEKLREKRTAEIEKKAEDSIEKVSRRADTFANMEIRNHLLSAKRTLLADVFAKTVTALAGSPDYVKILTALLKTAKKHFKEGTVVPAHGKEEETKKALKEADANFELAARSAQIKGGFIFKADSVEVDFSFESILAKELWGDLEMKLSKMLF